MKVFCIFFVDFFQIKVICECFEWWLEMFQVMLNWKCFCFDFGYFWKVLKDFELFDLMSYATEMCIWNFIVLFQTFMKQNISNDSIGAIWIG